MSSSKPLIDALIANNCFDVIIVIQRDLIIEDPPIQTSSMLILTASVSKTIQSSYCSHLKSLFPNLKYDLYHIRPATLTLPLEVWIEQELCVAYDTASVARETGADCNDSVEFKCHNSRCSHGI